MKYQEKIKTDRYPLRTALLAAVIIEDKGNRWPRGLAVHRRPRVQSSASKKKEDTLRVFNYLSCLCIPHLTWRVGYHSTHNGTSLSPCCSSISHWKAESEKGRTSSHFGVIKQTIPRERPRVWLAQDYSVCLAFERSQIQSPPLQKKKMNQKQIIKSNQGIILIWQSLSISREKLQSTKKAACKLLYSLAFILPNIQIVTLIMLCIYVPPFIQEHQSPWKSMNTSPILCHPGRFHSHFKRAKATGV